uniref:Uncharacterized protein n=1 Tax=Amphimedon queenslandica TaxID=400682 RepID=A0A1X7ULR6_AMPQE
HNISTCIHTRIKYNKENSLFFFFDEIWLMTLY